MKAYVFAAALLCESCGAKTREQLRATVKELHPSFDESNESTFDSDYYPKGPYGQGGGEADTPQHCDHCGVFLENPLTTDGAIYVREQVADTNFESVPGDDSWEDIARKADAGGKPVLAQWIRFYLAEGQ